jgi:hypothetical protein
VAPAWREELASLAHTPQSLPATFNSPNIQTDILQTTWGTREGADQDDNIRMIPIVPPMSPPPEGRVLRERGAILPTANTAVG